MASKGINTLYKPVVRGFRCFIIHLSVPSTALVESGSDFSCRLLNVPVGMQFFFNESWGWQSGLHQGLWRWL